MTRKDCTAYPLTRAARSRFILSQGRVCVLCGGTSASADLGPDGRPWHVDHALPRARGGCDHAHNLQLTCASCNQAKGAYTAFGQACGLTNEPPRRYRIRAVAAAHNLSLMALARRAGLDAGTVLRIANNTVRDARISSLFSLARALGVPLVDLFEPDYLFGPL